MECTYITDAERKTLIPLLKRTRWYYSRRRLEDLGDSFSKLHPNDECTRQDCLKCILGNEASGVCIKLFSICLSASLGHDMLEMYVKTAKLVALMEGILKQGRYPLKDKSHEAQKVK